MFGDGIPLFADGIPKFPDDGVSDAEVFGRGPMEIGVEFGVHFGVDFDGTVHVKALVFFFFFLRKIRFFKMIIQELLAFLRNGEPIKISPSFVYVY